MRTFTHFLEQSELIMEAKIDVLKAKWAKEKPRFHHDSVRNGGDDILFKRGFDNPHGYHEILDRIQEADPHPKKSNTNWMANAYRYGDYKLEDLPSVTDTLKQFDRFKSALPVEHRDISKHDLSSLRDVLRPHIEKSQQKANTIFEGADLIHDKDGVKVYHSKTMQATCELGAGMPWCTANRDPNINMFHNYTRHGVKHYVVHLANEQAPHRKLGVIFEHDEFQDENNRNIIKNGEIHGVLERNPALKEVPEWQGKSVLLTHDIQKHKKELMKNDMEGMIKGAHINGDDLHGLLEQAHNPENGDIHNLIHTRIREFYDKGIVDDTHIHKMMHLDDKRDEMYQERASFADRLTKQTFTMHQPLSAGHLHIISSHILPKYFDANYLKPDKSYGSDTKVGEKLELLSSLKSHPNLSDKHAEMIYHLTNKIKDAEGLHHSVKRTLKHINNEILSHKGIQTHIIDQKIESEDGSDLRGLAQNPNLRRRHVDVLLSKQDDPVHGRVIVQHLLENPDKLNKDDITDIIDRKYTRTHAIDHPSDSFGLAIINHPKATYEQKDHIRSLHDDFYDDINDPKYLTHALKTPTFGKIDGAALKNKHLHDEHVALILSHPKVTAPGLESFINHKITDLHTFNKIKEHISDDPEKVRTFTANVLSRTNRQDIIEAHKDTLDMAHQLSLGVNPNTTTEVKHHLRGRLHPDIVHTAGTFFK